MNNKKGISAIVATVLIILITVAAVTIIWAAIIPMINNQLESGTLCLDAVSQITLADVGYTCYSDGCSVATCGDDNDESCTTKATCEAESGGGWKSNVSLQIEHGAKDFVLADIQVLVSAAGDSTSFDLSNDDTTLLPTDTTVPFPGANEAKVYLVNTSEVIGTIDKVEIAPVVLVGNSQEACEISASKVLTACAG